MATIDFSLIHPFSSIFAGPSGSGKSSLLIRLLKERDLINFPIKSVLYIYTHFEPEFFNIQQNDPAVTFSNNIQDIESFNTIDSLLIIDDCLQYLVNDKYRQLIEHYFIQKSHHSRISIICVLQNLFPKQLRTIAINVHYLVLFKFLRDKSMVTRIACQCSPENSKFITDAYKKACSRMGFGHFVLDFSPKSTNGKYWVRSSLFPDSDCEVYVQ